MFDPESVKLKTLAEENERLNLLLKTQGEVINRLFKDIRRLEKQNNYLESQRMKKKVPNAYRKTGALT